MTLTNKRPYLMGWSAVLLGWLAAVPSVLGQNVAYTGSVQYATGSYIFSERTHSVYLFNGLTFSGDRISLSTSISVIFQNSPWISYSGVGGIPSGGPQHGSVGGGGKGPGGSGRGRRSGETIALPDTISYADVGIGDPFARVDLTLISGGRFWPGVQVAASAKAPIADVDRGFGTGAWDAGLGVSLSKRLGSWFVFADAMHWWLGDMTDATLGNSVAYSVALGRSLMEGKLGMIASLFGYTAEILEDVDPPVQAAFGINYSMAQGQYGLNGSVSAGLTESTPDVSVSLGWHVSL